MNRLDISPVRVWRYNQERRRLLGAFGTLEQFSVVRVGPVGLSNRTPYVIGLVKVGHELVLAQLADVEDIQIGMRLRGQLRKLFDVNKDGVIVYGIKFVPDYGGTK
jgi:hypothetical protein